MFWMVKIDSVSHFQINGTLHEKSIIESLKSIFVFTFSYTKIYFMCISEDKNISKHLYSKDCITYKFISSEIVFI